MMIIIIASVIGVLLLVIGAMIVRVVLKKRSVETLSAQKIDEVFTGVVEVEPQFVLAADDSKNIFARPSTAPLNDIEASENKKPGTADSRKKRKITKKVVVRKKMKSATRDINSASSEAVLKDQAGEESGDDGFRNYDGTSAPRILSPPDSATKSFNETNRSNAFAEVHNATTRKLNNVPLQRIDSD
jgi:hypothetical protein